MKINSSASLLSFENTMHACAYKSDKQLKEAAFIFSLMRSQRRLSIISHLFPQIINNDIPIVKAFVRNTIFKQFIGGESLDDSAKVIENLETFNVKVVLNYSAERKDNEQFYDNACSEFIRAIRFAGSQINVPFVAVKVTSIARISFLEKMNSLCKQYKRSLYNFSKIFQDKKELEELRRILARLNQICHEAWKNNVAVLIDAEESWVQDAIDAMATHLMENYNKAQWIVYNTIQLYRQKRMGYLHKELTRARKKDYLLGIKLVRGAYMESENKRATKLHYPTPIQHNKKLCDADFNRAVELCIRNLDHISVIIATQNESSSILGARLLDDLHLPSDHPGVYFSQLYGMGDNITFNLAKAGYNVSKYLPYGKMEEVVPYLMRRARENNGIIEQSERELSLIRKELLRRRRAMGA